MLKAIFRPIDVWPGKPTPAASRRRSPFDSTYLQTLDLMEAELTHVRATNLVIQLETKLSQIRNDGWLKADARVSGPGVIISFTIDGAAMSFPCDTFLGWQDNLRAIALSLEALRKIDRYGVTRRGEQYQGFRALPPPNTGLAPQLTVSQATQFLASKAPDGITPASIESSKDLFEMVYRSLQKKLHPDAGGSHEDFVKLQESGEVLTKHFRIRSSGAGQ